MDTFLQAYKYILLLPQIKLENLDSNLESHHCLVINLLWVLAK